VAREQFENALGLGLSCSSITLLSTTLLRGAIYAVPTKKLAGYFKIAEIIECENNCINC